MDENVADNPAELPDGAPASRRRVIALGVAAAGAAWVTPAILSVDAASAATDPPPLLPGTLQGEVTRCGHGLDPQGETYLLTATQNPGGAVGSQTVFGAASYQLSGLPAGTYDVTLTPNGNNSGPTQSYPAAAVVPAGGVAVFNPDYTANGC